METESYLSFEQFVANIKESQYGPIINCLNWEAASSIFFHGRGDCRAVQAVKVTSEIACGYQREYTYTFCLEKVMSVVVIGFTESQNVKSATVMRFPA